MRLVRSQIFTELAAAMPAAEKCILVSVQNIKKVIYERHSFTDNYLRMENSFFEIISALAAIGLSINGDAVVKALGEVIKTKIRLTQEAGAWSQYEHLAGWLIYLATILELKGTSIEAVFLEATLKSMTSMGSTQRWGYSWHAYAAWESDWSKIIASNRAIIRKHISDNTGWQDALAIVVR